MFETESDQSWNHIEESYLHLAVAGAAESGSLVYPVENMSIDGANFQSHWNPAPIDGANFPSHWNSAPSVNGYSSSTNHVEGPHYQPESSQPSREPYLHPSSAGSFCMVPENHGHYASSSNYAGQTFHGVEGSFVDLSMGNGTGPYKRKSPGVPSVDERGSTSRYVGSSSDLSVSSESWQGKPNSECHPTRWDYTTLTHSYGGNNLSIGGEGIRNVRSRGTLDLETNLASTHLSSNPSHHNYTASRPADHSWSVDHLGQSSNAPAREWNQTVISPAAHDTTVFNHEMNHFIVGTNNPSASLEIAGCNNDYIACRNPVPQYLQATATQSVRGVRSSYTQRSGPTLRASSSNLSAAQSDEGLQFDAESYSSRHARSFSNIGWRNSDRNGRTRISSERCRPHFDDARVRDRLASQGIIVVERSALYGSRSLFDQHRDMRLDIDNMSYEELLALGERIGSVNTGLSEDLIPKCLMESIYCSSDQIQEEGSCVICLEEYKNMDDVGMLKA